MLCYNFDILDGSYQQLTYTYDVIQSKGDKQNLAMVAVIDGSELHFCFTFTICFFEIFLNFLISSINSFHSFNKTFSLGTLE